MNFKKLLEDNFNYLHNMRVPEYTLYKKWTDLNTDKNLKWYNKNQKQISYIKDNIWKPKELNDYKNLNLVVIPCDNPTLLLNWRILRVLTHSAVWKSSPGRMARFIVAHKEINNDLFGFGFKEPELKYLGVISMGSDFIGIGGRDKYIGWTTDDKLKRGMLKHTAMGSSISPTQPLGYNYLGGKLISLMVCSDIVENTWNSKYKEKLVGITTTSLYGGYSQYTRLNYWRKCKTSEGKINLEPTEDVYEKLKIWFKEKYPEIYTKSQKGSHPKPRLLGLIYKELGVRPPINNAPRGVYWCSLYDNTNNFLNRTDEELGKKKFDNKVNILTDLWKEKYAKKRIEKMKDNFKPEILFYDKLIDNTWEDVKKHYLKDIGR